MIFINNASQSNPVVITGDFNSTATEKAYKFIAERYNDSRLVATETENKITFHNYGRNIGNVGVIDFIFASKDVSILRYKAIDNMVKKCICPTTTDCALMCVSDNKI